MKPAEPGLEFSCHAYYYERDAVNRQDFLALDEDMKSFITVVVDVADNVRAADHSRRDIMLCFGDWGGGDLETGCLEPAGGVSESPSEPRRQPLAEALRSKRLIAHAAL
ncbi:hypothetical protein JNUCC75_05055 [Bifidobacterium polysaccharolyticum]